MTESTKTISIAAAAITIMGGVLGFLLFGASINQAHSETYPPVTVMLVDGTAKTYQDGIIPQSDLENVRVYNLAVRFNDDVDAMLSKYRANKGVDNRAALVYGEAAIKALKGVCMSAKLIGKQNLPPTARGLDCSRFTEADFKM